MKVYAEEYLDASFSEPSIRDFCIPESFIIIIFFFTEYRDLDLQKVIQVVLHERPYHVLLNVIALVPFPIAICPLSQKHTFGS